MDISVKPIESLRGEIDLPGDKSISHRVVFIGGIARGRTEGKNFLKADDCMRTCAAFQKMGIEIGLRGKNVSIMGKGLKGLKDPDEILYVGNSGTTMRILPGILAGQSFSVVLTGDDSLSKRPMKRVIEPLRRMGVGITSRNTDYFPPLEVKGGRVSPVEYTTKVASAQVKSCILFAGLYANGLTSVTEPFKSRDHTERMLEFWGAKICHEKLTARVEGTHELEGKNFFIPGDISSAAFFIAAACMLEGSEISIRDVGLNPTRSGFLQVLKRMGADINIIKQEKSAEPYGDIRIRYARLKNTTVKEDEIPLLIDEVPVLAVVAARSEGEMIIKGISELKVKETDRINSIAENLKLMGVDVIPAEDRLIIRGVKERLQKAELTSFGDHRTAMGMAVAALSADGPCSIKDIDCVRTSFPDFFNVLDHLKK